jgi:hypothetical protein
MGSDGLYSNRGKDCGIMSSDVTKRALSAGFGGGALALLAPRASADTPFSSFAFRATGAPTVRTMPDRLGDVKNVKDFGARGDGTGDDAPAIQAAVNAGGTVFIPPGNYNIGSSITCNGNGRRFLGYSAALNWIANHPGFIIDRSGGNDQDGPFIVEGLFMRNYFYAGPRQGNGCVRFAAATNCHVRDCLLEGFGGVVMGEATPDSPVSGRGILNGSVKRCWLRAANMPGHIVNRLSIGIYGHSNQFIVEQCDINGFYMGIGASFGCAIRDCRIEMCYIGIKLGIDLHENGYPGGGEISNTTFDGNTISIWLHTVASTHIRGVDILGEDFAPTLQGMPGGAYAIAGIKIEPWAKLLTFQNFKVYGDFSDGAIVFPTAAGSLPTQSVFMGVSAEVYARSGGTAWKNLTANNHAGLTLIQCK